MRRGGARPLPSLQGLEERFRHGTLPLVALHERFVDAAPLERAVELAHRFLGKHARRIARAVRCDPRAGVRRFVEAWDERSFRFPAHTTDLDGVMAAIERGVPHPGGDAFEWVSTSPRTARPAVLLLWGIARSLPPWWDDEEVFVRELRARCAAYGGPALAARREAAPREGFDTWEIERRLEGTPYRGAADLAAWMGRETGNPSWTGMSTTC